MIMNPCKDSLVILGNYRLHFKIGSKNLIYIDDEGSGRSDSAIQYWDGRIAYDFPERIPKYIRCKVEKMFTQVHKGAK